MFSYDVMAYHAAETLGKYNFEEDIQLCKQKKVLDPYDIREFLYTQERYPDEVADALEELSLDEFMEYLTAKYGVRWEEIITYRMW